jgi:hypothetical protein
MSINRNWFAESPAPLLRGAWSEPVLALCSWRAAGGDSRSYAVAGPHQGAHRGPVHSQTFLSARQKLEGADDWIARRISGRSYLDWLRQRDHSSALSVLPPSRWRHGRNRRFPRRDSFAMLGLVHLHMGTVDLRLVGLLLAGAVVGVPLGAKLASLIPSLWLRRAVLLMLIPLGIKLL